MSVQAKLIIPLLDKKIKKEYLTKEAGFVDMYVHDINRPYIENCIFLLYKIGIKTDLACECEYCMRECKNTHSVKIEYINNEPYRIYAFPLLGSDSKKIYKGFKPKDDENISRILGFWKGSDIDVNNVMMKNNIYGVKVDWKTLPEYDYHPSFLETQIGGYL